MKEIGRGREGGVWGRGGFQEDKDVRAKRERVGLRKERDERERGNQTVCNHSNWVTSREHCVSVNTAAPVLCP